MYFTPIEAALIAVMLICGVLWMTILIEDVIKIVGGNGDLTPGEITNLILLAAFGLIALAVYCVFGEL